jgi:hypothetical protein
MKDEFKPGTVQPSLPLPLPLLLSLLENQRAIALFPVTLPTDHDIGRSLGEAPRPPVGIWGPTPRSWFSATRTLRVHTS